MRSQNRHGSYKHKGVQLWSDKGTLLQDQPQVRHCAGCWLCNDIHPNPILDTIDMSSAYNQYGSLGSDARQLPPAYPAGHNAGRAPQPGHQNAPFLSFVNAYQSVPPLQQPLQNLALRSKGVATSNIWNQSFSKSGSAAGAPRRQMSPIHSPLAQPASRGKVRFTLLRRQCSFRNTQSSAQRPQDTPPVSVLKCIGPS